MIRYRFEGSEKHPAPIAFIGLSEDNLTRMRAGPPIRIKADDPLGLAIELVIYTGPNEVEMTKELENAGFMPEGATEGARAAMESHGEYRLWLTTS